MIINRCVMRMGDRVKFINDIGGGIVKKFPKDTRFVVVTDDNGFEIPVLKEECVVVKPGLDYGRVSKSQKLTALKKGATGKSTKKPVNGTANRNNNMLEVDLHIEKLRLTDKSIDSGSALVYQMDMVRHILKGNKNKKGTKIVFIHGQGEGILRGEIIKEIEEKFPGYSWSDASFARYGVGGALEVRI